MRRGERGVREGRSEGSSVGGHHVDAASYDREPHLRERALDLRGCGLRERRRREHRQRQSEEREGDASGRVRSSGRRKHRVEGEG